MASTYSSISLSMKFSQAARLACASFAIQCLDAVALPVSTTTAEPQLLKVPLRRIMRSSHPLLERDASAASTPAYYDQEMSELAIPVEVGSPGQEFLLLFDTGSSDVWVSSPKCTTKEGCVSGQHVYNSSASSTYSPSKYEFEITYGSGSDNGSYFVDQVTVANITLSKQIVAMVDDSAGTISDQSPSDQLIVDGVFGAGFPLGTAMYGKYNVTYPTVPQALYETKLIPAPMFSVYMGPVFADAASSSSTTGSVVFGGYDQSLIGGEIVYSDLVTSDIGDQKGVYEEWSILVPRIVINQGQAGEHQLTFDQEAFLMDTGSNFVYIPEQDANALASALVPTFTRNGTFYEGDCAPYENSDTTVSFHFQASSQSKGTVYITLPLHRLLRHVDSAGQTCRLSISASSGSDYILGNYVLGHFVTIFDFGNKRVGFAPVASS